MITRVLFFVLLVTVARATHVRFTSASAQYVMQIEAGGASYYVAPGDSLVLDADTDLQIAASWLDDSAGLVASSAVHTVVPPCDVLVFRSGEALVCYDSGLSSVPSSWAPLALDLELLLAGFAAGFGALVPVVVVGWLQRVFAEAD